MSGFEYRRATWDEVRELGPQGWRLVPLPPVQEVKQVLGQMQASEPLYVMEREIAAKRGPDEAAARTGLGPIARSFLPESR